VLGGLAPGRHRVRCLASTVPAAACSHAHHVRRPSCRSDKPPAVNTRLWPIYLEGLATCRPSIRVTVTARVDGESAKDRLHSPHAKRCSKGHAAHIVRGPESSAYDSGCHPRQSTRPMLAERQLDLESLTITPAAAAGAGPQPTVDRPRARSARYGQQCNFAPGGGGHALPPLDYTRKFTSPTQRRTEFGLIESRQLSCTRPPRPGIVVVTTVPPNPRLFSPCPARA